MILQPLSNKFNLSFGSKAYHDNNKKNNYQNKHRNQAALACKPLNNYLTSMEEESSKLASNIISNNNHQNFMF